MLLHGWAFPPNRFPPPFSAAFPRNTASLHQTNAMRKGAGHGNREQSLVPGGGVEPPRPEGRRILSSPRTRNQRFSVICLFLLSLVFMRLSQYSLTRETKACKPPLGTILGTVSWRSHRDARLYAASSQAESIDQLVEAKISFHLSLSRNRPPRHLYPVCRCSGQSRAIPAQLKVANKTDQPSVIRRNLMYRLWYTN